jgi:hypothetical protein
MKRRRRRSILRAEDHAHDLGSLERERGREGGRGRERELERGGKRGRAERERALSFLVWNSTKTGA